MPVQRRHGTVQPGWNWGPFTLRVPLYHTRVEVSELLQGFLVAGATGLALVPLLTGPTFFLAPPTFPIWNQP